MHLNIEIKARTHRHAEIREILKQENAWFKGVDTQTDTYFPCDKGRLKLRSGNIENSLIFYRRQDQEGPKSSEVFLSVLPSETHLRETLSAALGVWKEVKKTREIYFIGHIKFHLDTLEGLGQFVEIEAIDSDGSIGEKQLRADCDRFIALFGIRPEDLLRGSYSDMV